jgi:hypothetical protein
VRTRTGLPGLALALALVVVAVGCGTSSGSDDASNTTTTRPAATTTGDAAATDDDLDDEELMGSFLDQYQPGFELVFDDETAGCVIDVFTEASLGDQSDESIYAQYEACGVTQQEVTGAIMAAQLLDQGVSEEKSLCISDAIGELSADELDSMDDAQGSALAEACGIDPESLGG